MSVFNFNNPPAPGPSTGGAFGIQAPQQQTAAAAPGASFSFGNPSNTATNANNTGGGLFGSTSVQPGQQQPQQQPGGGGLFGGTSNTTTGLFGGNGFANNQNQGANGLGQSTSGGMGMFNQQQQQPQQQQQQGQQPFGQGSVFGNQNPPNNTFQPNQSTFNTNQSTANLNQSTLGMFAPNQSTSGPSIYANSAVIPKKKTLQERLHAVMYGVAGQSEQKEIKVSGYQWDYQRRTVGLNRGVVPVIRIRDALRTERARACMEYGDAEHDHEGPVR